MVGFRMVMGTNRGLMDLIVSLSLVPIVSR
jgi:hypothetical protein